MTLPQARLVADDFSQMHPDILMHAAAALLAQLEVSDEDQSLACELVERARAGKRLEG